MQQPAALVGVTTDTAPAGEAEVAARRAARLAEHLRLVTDALPALISYIDANGRYRFNNKAYENWFGLRRADVLGMHLREVLGEAAFESIRPHVEKALAGTRSQFEGKVPYKDGGTRFIRADYVPDIRPDGTVAGFYAFVIDITEKKSAEKALRDSQAKFATAFNYSPLGLTVTSLDTGKLIEINEGFLRLTGYTREQVLGRSPDELDLWVDPAQRQQRFAMLQAGQRPPDVETRFRGRNGEELWGVIGSALVQIDGRPCVLSSVTDITKRKHVEQALRQRTAQFETLLNEAPLGVYLIDADFRIRAVNPAAAPTFGGIPDLIGKDFAEVMHILWFREKAEEIVQLFRRTLDTGVSSLIPEFAEQRRDRAVTEYYEWQINRIPLPDGRFGVVCYFRDISAQVQARRAIAESAERLRFMAESMPQKIFTATARGEVDYFNPQWSEFTGLPFEQIRDWGWTQCVHPDDVDENVRVWRHSIETGEPFAFEHRFRRADGQYRWHLTRAVPFRDGAGRITMWAGSNTDIHQLKEAENRQRFLVELNTATQSLSDPDQIMAVTARMLGDHLEVNRCAYAEIGPDEDQAEVTGDYVRGVASLVGRWSLSAFGDAAPLLRAGKNHVIHDVAREVADPAAREAYRKTQIQASIAVPLRKDGKLRAAMSVNQQTPRRWLAEEIELVDQVVHRCWETIERARALRRLRDSEARKSAVVNSSLDGIISMDHAGRIVEWNPAAEGIFGYRRAEAVGRPMDQTIIPPALRERHRQGLAHFLKTGEGPVLGRRIEVQALRSDGAEFPAELSITPIPGTDPPEFTGMIRDITERKHAEQALKDNDRRKDEFLATLAHELRNPLAPIRNSLGLLRLAGGSQPIHEMMERQVNHMVRLVDDLLEISRISRGKIELRRERVELSAIIHSALETARPLMLAVGHRFHVALPPEPLAVDADPVRLTQVFANLLNNAAKYTPPGGRIDLEVVRDGGQAVVSVRDNGAGIPETMLPRVFEMFTQVDRTLNRAQGGLGIGLSLARNLIEMHGGRITARSGGPGKGSEFIVRLPLADKRANTAGAAVETKPPPARVRSPHAILVVDDNRDAADSLGMLLKFLGAEVRVEHSGPAALEALKSFKPSVVLLDLGMPGMDGLEVARRMRQLEGPGLTLIALTGWGQEDDRRRTLEAGFDHHLVKPPDVTALQALLASLEQPRKGPAPV